MYIYKPRKIKINPSNIPKGRRQTSNASIFSIFQSINTAKKYAAETTKFIRIWQSRKMESVSRNHHLSDSLILSAPFHTDFMHVYVYIFLYLYSFALFIDMQRETHIVFHLILCFCVCVSLKSMDYRKMDTEALNQMLLDRIKELERKVIFVS